MNFWSISASISVTITYVWTKFDTELKYYTINTPEWWNSHNPKIQDGGRRHLGFLNYVKRKMSITPDWIKISASNFTGQCTGHWLIQQAVITACTVVQAVLTVWTVVSCSNNLSTKLGSGWLCYRNTSKNYADHVPCTTYKLQKGDITQQHIDT